MITNDLAVVFGQPSQMANSHINCPYNEIPRAGDRSEFLEKEKKNAHSIYR